MLSMKTLIDDSIQVLSISVTIDSYCYSVYLNLKEVCTKRIHTHTLLAHWGVLG